MKIINPYSFGVALPSPNTFIGGVGATSVTSITDFIALTTGIIAANISNFQIDNLNNVSFFCDASYTVNGTAFLDDTALTYYIDEKCTQLNAAAFQTAVNSTYYYLPNVTITTTGIWRESLNIKVISIPLLTPIGTNSGENGGLVDCPNLDYVITHLDNQTNNASNPDGDLTQAGVTIANIRYVTNTTPPSDITDLAVDTVFGVNLGISWSAPSTTNTIIYYEVWVDDAFVDLTTSISYIITGLSLNTSYKIQIRTLDEFGNRSGFSNTVNQTTSATYVIPTGNIISYYPLNSNSNDSVGTNNGTDTSMSYDAGGVVGNRGNFTAATTSKIEIADDNSLSFGNGTTDTAFSWSCWVKWASVGDSWILNKRDVSASPWEYQLSYFSGDLRIQLNDQSDGQIAIKATSFTPTAGVWYYIAFAYDGSSTVSGITMYIDGVAIAITDISSGIYTAMENGAAVLTLGKASWVSTLSLNGYLDETALFNIELSAIQVLEIKAKNDANLGLTA